MTVNPAVAPYVQTYATRVPYLTVDEFLAEPTGVDVSAIVAGGTQGQQSSALLREIMTASSYADVLCHQVLAATLDTQVGEYRIMRDGTIRVPVDYTPLVAVTDVKLGYAAGQLQSMTDLSGLWLDRKVIRVPVWSFAGSTPNVAPLSVARSGLVFAQVTYVNGFANTTLSAAANPGDSSVSVTSPLGIFPGLTLNVVDPKGSSTADQSETVTVASTYTVGLSTVPLSSPLVSGHSSGVAVSALPRAVKQAVVCLVSHLIKTRGGESISFDSMSSGPGRVQADSPGYTEEYQQAVDLLEEFRRVA